ncbi:MAG: lipopolysaccharide kinase InaA family protein, partial [Candidatus Brocadiaceae bacterium]
MGTGRPTRTIPAHGMKWRCIPEFAPTVPLLDVDRLRRPGQLSPSELVKDSTTRTVARIPDPSNPAGPGLYVKRYKFRDLRDRVRYRFVPSKPRKEWRICRALQQRGIPTCDVLAIAVRHRWGLPCEGFLVSRELTDTFTLKEFLSGEFPAMAEKQPDLRRELTVELAALTARLVDARFYHHDYHAGNLLVRPEAAPGERL